MSTIPTLIVGIDYVLAIKTNNPGGLKAQAVVAIMLTFGCSFSV